MPGDNDRSSEQGRRTQYRISLVQMETHTLDALRFEPEFLFNNTTAVASRKSSVDPKFNNTAKKGSVNGLPACCCIPPVRHGSLNRDRAPAIEAEVDPRLNKGPAPPNRSGNRVDYAVAAMEVG